MIVNNKSESLHITICKMVLACACAWFIFKLMANKYSSTIIVRIIMIMTFLITQTKGEFNKSIIIIVLLCVLFLVFCLVLDKDATMKYFTVQNKITFGDLNHKDKITYAKVEYVNYLIKEANLPRKIAQKYTDYSAKHMDNKKKITLMASTNNEIEYYFAQTTSGDSMTKLIFLGTKKIKSNPVDIKENVGNTKDVKENDEKDIKGNTGDDKKDILKDIIKRMVKAKLNEKIKEKREAFHKELINNKEVILAEIKAEIKKDIKNIKEDIKNKLINNIKDENNGDIKENIKDEINEDIKDETIKEGIKEDIKEESIQSITNNEISINMIRDLMKNSDENVKEQIMEICNNYSKQKGSNIVI